MTLDAEYATRPETENGSRCLASRPVMKLSPKQAAERAGVSPSLVYTWCREKRLAHYRVGAEGRRGRIRIDPADLDAFVRSLRQEVHPLLASG
jgi:excisionase family DNA binding protein